MLFLSEAVRCLNSPWDFGLNSACTLAFPFATRCYRGFNTTFFFYIFVSTEFIKNVSSLNLLGVANILSTQIMPLFSGVCITYSEKWSFMCFECSGNTSFWRGCCRHVSRGHSKVLRLYIWSIWHIVCLSCVMSKSFHAIYWITVSINSNFGFGQHNNVLNLFYQTATSINSSSWFGETSQHPEFP